MNGRVDWIITAFYCSYGADDGLSTQNTLYAPSDDDRKM